MKLEAGKYYSMKIVKTPSRVSVENRLIPDTSSTVFFKLDKLVFRPEHPDDLSHYDVWASETISIEKKYHTSLRNIGVWTGERLIPRNMFMYKYNEIKEITPEEFRKKVKYSSYGL
jgi:hypothetical protein